jgi:arylsulfatase A-like enzyme
VFFGSKAIDFTWNKEISGHPEFNDLGIDDRFTVAQYGEQIASINSEGKNFAGVLHFNTTHYPYNVPQEYDRFGDSQIDKYDNSCLYQDDLFRRAFAYLSDLKILENTIVVITSDHGEAFKEHEFTGHVDCNFIETISVPMMFFIPSALQSEFNTNNLIANENRNVSNLDLIPTFIDIFGLTRDEQISDLKNQMHGQSLFSEIDPTRHISICNSSEVASASVGVSAIMGDYHYLFRTNISPRREEAYNFISDVWEKNNLWESLPQDVKDKLKLPLLSYPVAKEIIEGEATY